jgi:multiple sugar transport system substrate-binding protein
MWQKGEWDWDVLLDMVSKFSEPDEKWGIKGFYIDEAAVLSTGVGIISIENGLLKHNMDDNRIERATNLLLTLALNEFRFPYHERSDFNLVPTEFRNGNVLFWNDGPWVYQERWKDFAAADDWEDDEVRIVPFPMDPDAREHFIRGKQDAMMLVNGARNIDGFRAWTYSLLLAHQDEVMQEQTRERSKQMYNWTDHHLDVLERLRDPDLYSLVWDFKNGIGPIASCPTSPSPIENLTKRILVEDDPYPVNRDANRGVIIEWVDTINESVGG